MIHLAALLLLLSRAPAGAVTLEGATPAETPIPALPVPTPPVLEQNGTVVPGQTLEAPGVVGAELPQSPDLVQRQAAPEQAQRADSARAEAEGLVARFAQPGGAQAALPAVFDGNFKKGSLEAQLLAPMPGVDGKIDLARIDTADTGDLSKKKAKRKLERDREALDLYQQKIFADKKRKILLVLQGMDTGGKDGIIKHVLKGLNPQGFKISGFKKPTKEEAAEGYWPRIKRALGGPGIITVFNRSHYEDALVPYAKKLQPIDKIDATIADINRKEKELVDDGWTIVKIFLHVSKETNRERLEARRTTKRKWWKLSPDDIVSREHWQENQDAYSYVIPRTSTPYAPWFIVPADKKWYRNYAVGRLFRRALKRLHPRWPRPNDLPKKIPR